MKTMGLLGKRLNEISPEDLELIKEAASALSRSGAALEQTLIQPLSISFTSSSKTVC